MTILQQVLIPEQLGTAQALAATPTLLLVRLLVDIITVGILIRLIYFRIYQKSDLFLTFFSFNLIIFLITYLLNQVQMSIGAAFGLFAVFSMLRYRTEGLSAKDMTYLFIVISVGLISAVSNGGIIQVIILNSIILLVVQFLESNWLFQKEYCKTIIYDRIDLITPLRRPELIDDLRFRTGLPIHRASIQDIDFLKDAANITIYYYETAPKTSVPTAGNEIPESINYTSSIR